MIDSNLGIINASAVGLLGGSGRTPSSRRSIGDIIANITTEEQHSDEIEITRHPVEVGASITDHIFKRPPEVVIRCSWTNSPQTQLDAAASIASKLVQDAQDNAIATANSFLPAQARTAIVEQGVLSGDVGSFVQSTNNGVGVGTSLIQDVYQQLLELQISGELIDIYTGKRIYENMLIKSLHTGSDVRSENALNCTLVCVNVIVVSTQTTTISATVQNQSQASATNPAADLGTKQAAPVDPSSNTDLLGALMSTF